jgi:penicillin-binding protein 1C
VSKRVWRPAARRVLGGWRLGALLLALVCAGAGTALALRTVADYEPLPVTLPPAEDGTPGLARGVQVVDRNGEPLNATFTGAWNRHEIAALHEVPEFLRHAFVAAEDKRFFEHHGVDWSARISAVVLNLRNGRAIRGASTITEQVVGMLHPRPPSVWSRWLEGWEAQELERRFTKNEILEFYLNQVPYASNRRGVRQAASRYFARDIDTLNKREMLALAVLVRAPTRFDLKRDAAASAAAIERLANTLVERGQLAPAARDELLAQPFELEAPRLAVSAPHFVQHVRAELAGTTALPKVTTTLDARLQATAQRMLDERLRQLHVQQVANGAVLAIEHSSGEVLAWVVAGGGGPDGPVSHIDAVTTPRQAGSALKPFLYALALDGGWSAAEVIDDSPLAEVAAGGLHNYRNYSRRFYGPIALRDALGNSLNIPALRTLQHVGAEAYLAKLATLGFASLTRHPDFYGDGIALGNGGVTLFELVQAYAALANGGVFRPLTARLHDDSLRAARRVYSPEAASLVANILSDPDARALEFGRAGVLSFPVQTAVKTGTSSDFHDAWAVGFNYRYTVGVWMGNLDHSAADGLTGSTGPALLLRAVFAELTRNRETRPLALSPRLARGSVCVPRPPSDASTASCLERDEWFLPGSEPRAGEPTATAVGSAANAGAALRPSARVREPIGLRKPSPGLHLAYDPRLPPKSQVFEFAMRGVESGDEVHWTVDGRPQPGHGGTFRWAIVRGEHRVAARVRRDGVLIADLAEVPFIVK